MKKHQGSCDAGDLIIPIATQFLLNEVLGRCELEMPLPGCNQRLSFGNPRWKCTLQVFHDGEQHAGQGADITVAVDDIYGNDSLYVAAVCDGEYIGCFDRAPAHPVNWWGHWVVECSHKSSHYIRVDENMRGKKIDIYALHFDFDMEDFRVFAYLCESKGTMLGAELKLER